MLHLINVNLDNMSFDNRFRCLLINNPLCEEILSAGAAVAGTHKNQKDMRSMHRIV
jgi:hypothetical protein